VSTSPVFGENVGRFLCSRFSVTHTHDPFLVVLQKSFYEKIYVILILSFELYDYPLKTVSVSALIRDSRRGSKKRESQMYVHVLIASGFVANEREGYECR